MGSTGIISVKDVAAALLKSGVAFQRMGDHESAIESFTKVLESSPSSVEALHARGVSCLQRNDVERALADFNSAINANATFAVAYYGRGTAYRDKGDLDRTLADYGRAVELEPENADFMASRGYVHFFQGEFKQAASDLARAIELGGDAYCVIFRYLARVRANDNRALAELEEATSRSKQKSWPLAAAELLAGKRAAEATLAAAESPEETAEAHFYIGQWHLIQGDKAAATAEFKTVVETCPKSYIEYAVAAQYLKA